MKSPRVPLALGCLIVVRVMARCAALSLLVSFAPRAFAAAAATGTISGSVSNAGTGDFLEGVRVSLPDLGLTVFTDNTGHYSFPSVPPGSHQIVANYTGLDAMKHEVSVTAGQPVTRDFELTAGVYKLEAFTVAGEREG